MKNQQYKEPAEEAPLEDEMEDDEFVLGELNFSDEPPPTFGELEMDPDAEGDDIFAQAREAGLTEAALPGHGPTDDDLTPETLIHEDGALSPHEKGGDEANDQHLRIVDESDISDALNDELVGDADLILDEDEDAEDEDDELEDDDDIEDEDETDDDDDTEDDDLDDEDDDLDVHK